MKKNQTKDTCSGQKYTKAIYAFYQFPRNTFQMHIYHWWNKLCVLVHACRHCVWLCTYLLVWQRFKACLVDACPTTGFSPGIDPSWQPTTEIDGLDRSAAWQLTLSGDRIKQALNYLKKRLFVEKEW